MHEQFDSVGGTERYRMAGGMNCYHLPIAGGKQPSISGINGKPIPDHFLRKDRIGNALQSPDLPGKWRRNFGPAG